MCVPCAMVHYDLSTLARAVCIVYATNMWRTIEKRKVSIKFKFLYEVAFIPVQNWTLQLIFTGFHLEYSEMNHVTFHKSIHI